MSPEELQKIEERVNAYKQKWHYKNFVPGGSVAFTAEMTDNCEALLAALKEKDAIIKNLEAELKFIHDSETPEAFFPMMIKPTKTMKFTMKLDADEELK